MGIKTADLWKVSSLMEILFNTDSALITGIKTSPLLIIMASQLANEPDCIKHWWGVYEQISQKDNGKTLNHFTKWQKVGVNRVNFCECKQITMTKLHYNS